jgi:hypothetical protein
MAEFPASPDGASILLTALEWLRHWGGPVVGLGSIGFVFRAGRIAQEIKNKQDDHGGKLEEQKRDIEALKAGRAAADVKIAELPTRAELAAAVVTMSGRLDSGLATMAGRIESGFQMLSNMIGQRRPD